MSIYKNNKIYNIIISLMILLGIVIRVIGIDKLPIGLNCDEASAAYDSYSILTTLRDRNNVFLPVYLLAWGSGQSSLLTYIMIPFIKIFGLNIITTRLPMAIISSMSILVFYKILKLCFDDDKSNGKFYILFGTLFFVLNPWHIMKSRWGLDCNLLPDLVLYGVYFLIKFFKYDDKKSSFNLILAFVMFSISAYSYATAYLGLAIFCILIYIYGLTNHKISLKQVLCTIMITLLLTWPLILFVIVNFFNLDSIELPFLTIPRLRANRMLGSSILSSSNIFLSLAHNLIASFKLYITQNDDIYWNGLKGIGMCYIYSFPICLIGIVSFIRERFIIKIDNKNVVDDLFFIWFTSAFILNLFHQEININRANFIIIPFIYFVIKGFTLLFNVKVMKVFSLILLTLSFINFSYTYVDASIKKEKGILIEGINDAQYDCFAVGIEPVIKYVDSLNAKEICFYTSIRESYIYVLYYLKKSPIDYYKNHELLYKDAIFNAVKVYGNWHFDQPSTLVMDPGYVYILEKGMAKVIDSTIFDIKEMNSYIVVRYKG